MVGYRVQGMDREAISPRVIRYTFALSGTVTRDIHTEQYDLTVEDAESRTPKWVRVASLVDAFNEGRKVSRRRHLTNYVVKPYEWWVEEPTRSRPWHYTIRLSVTVLVCSLPDREADIKAFDCAALMSAIEVEVSKNLAGAIQNHCDVLERKMRASIISHLGEPETVC